MSEQIEALKLALEALEDFSHKQCYDNGEGEIGSRVCCEVLSYKAHDESCKVIKAITAIKEALAQPEKDYERGFVDGMQKQMQSSVDKAVNRMAQPEQEPWCMKMNGCKTKCEDCPDEPPQPEQEPVAWRTFDGEGGYDYRSYEDNESYADDWSKRNPNHVEWVDKLYTHPQQTWIGLTDEELHQICNSLDYYGDRELVQLIEAKLKQKNGYAGENT